MEQDNVIEVRNVTKKFKIYHDKGKMLKERVISWKRNKYEERMVLNGISFSVKKGEALGLIGHNGCGKSTTLKLLTRIMYPTSGTIEIKGRVSSLLELGAGFHPDLSGRENIYINASIFGLTKKEIDKRIKDIIEFSELEEFIDNPVRTYSSGMYMRLAFSVAINVDADVLLIDEILAVGDVNFQVKCFNKLMEIKRSGTTIVLVSHSMDQIEQVCDRCIWLNQGIIQCEGKTRDVNNEYLRYMGNVRKENSEKQNSQETNEVVESKTEITDHIGTGEVQFISVKPYNEKGEETYVFDDTEKIIFEIKYQVFKPILNAYIGLSVFRNDGVRSYGTNTRVDDLEPLVLTKDGSAQIVFEKDYFMPGQYFVAICTAIGNDEVVDFCDNLCQFEIYGNRKDIGTVRVPHEWILDKVL